MRRSKWVKSLNGKGFMVPDDIWEVNNEIRSRMDQKLDALVIITGKPGSGKSNMAKGIAGTQSEIFEGNPYTLENVHFSAESVVERTNLPDNKREVIHYDEAVQGGTSLDGQSKIGKILRKAMITKRSKQHLYIACVDSLKELNDKIIERCVVWYHVFYIRDRNGIYRKGIYKTFKANQALKVYKDLKDRKVWTTEDHYIFKSNRKCKKYPLSENIFYDEDEYDKKKSEMTDLLDLKDDKYLMQRNRMVMWALDKGTKQSEIAPILGLTRQAISDIKQKMRQASSP